MALVRTWGWGGGLMGRHYYKKFPSEIPVKSRQSTARPSIQSALCIDNPKELLEESWFLLARKVACFMCVHFEGI